MKCQRIDYCLEPDEREHEESVDKSETPEDDTVSQTQTGITWFQGLV